LRFKRDKVDPGSTMTKDNEAISSKQLVQVFLVLISTLAGSLGMHVLDAFEIKGRVEQIQTNQKDVMDYVAKDKIRWEKLTNEDFPGIVKAQWLINKRLCAYLISHGEADKECSHELYNEEKLPVKSSKKQNNKLADMQVVTPRASH
jgi:hypothetical protein